MSNKESTFGHRKSSDSSSWYNRYNAKKKFRSRGCRGSWRNTRETGESNGGHTINISNIDEPPTNNSNNPITRKIMSKQKCPYAGWHLYFPHLEYKINVEIVQHTKAVQNFIELQLGMFDLLAIQESRVCVFDYNTLLTNEAFLKDWPDFKNDLIGEPSTTLNCLGLAVFQTCWNKSNEPEVNNSKMSTIQIRITNYNTYTLLKNLRTNFYGKFISICGTVIRVSNIKLQCSWLAFECSGCSSIQSIKQLEGQFTQPKSCDNSECNSRKFYPQRSSPHTTTFDFQILKVQEIVSNQSNEGGRVPRTIDCELSNELVNACSPGDLVVICGIVQVKNSVGFLKKNKGPNMFSMYLEVVNIQNNKENLKKNNIKGEQNNGLAVEFTQLDFDAIQEIHSQPELFKLLVQSLCPAIYGHEMVKAGLLLAIMGGTQKEGLNNRSYIHMLVVGDPGLGKSQMLQACSFIAPRGVFVCGNTTTSSGLTVTLSKESGGDYALEAGALVLADQGCCCIDEFDKMSSQHQALLEVMEQQTVSIAKAGVICMMPARTTVLAAANPTGGHYDKGKTVAENLRMGQALLSRFDLVFILLDKPNEKIDSLLSAHVMKIHSGGNKPLENFAGLRDANRFDALCLQSESLNSKLKKKETEELDLIPPELLRKYIAYCRKYVPNVILSDEARQKIQQFYLKLREDHHTTESTPVTTRQLWSLIRLTQARAKLALREIASMEDALDVIEIVKWSLIDTFSDEHGTMDFSRSQNGSGISTRSQAKRFINFLHKQSILLKKNTFTIGEMKTFAKLAKVDLVNFTSFIFTLNTQGYLLKKGKDKYQVLSVE